MTAIIILKFTWTGFTISFLCISLGLILLILAYKKLLAHLGKGKITHTDFCVLYPLENPNVSGELELYYTCEHLIPVKINILNSDLVFVKNIYDKTSKIGGNIIRCDLETFDLGDYFYELKTDKQRTMKKFRIVKKA